MSKFIEDMVSDIHDQQGRCVIMTAGGGSGIFPLILQDGGGSNTLLDGGIPYGVNAIPAYLGKDANIKLVSGKAARSMALQSFRRAIILRGEEKYPVFGIACTASLTKKGAEREGRVHECYFAVQDDDHTKEVHVVFSGGSRREQEDAVAAILLDLIAEEKGVNERVCDQGGGLDITTRVENAKTCRHHDLPKLMRGEVAYLTFGIGHGTPPIPRDLHKITGIGLLPSSFRPPHEGHFEMRRQATARFKMPFHLELCIKNADKLPLDYVDIKDVLDMIMKAPMEGVLIMTNLPTFVEKAAVFRDSIFIVGYDTAIRIMDPNFYGGVAARDQAYHSMKDNNARFMVFGRVDGKGEFHNLDDNRDSFPDMQSHVFFTQNGLVVSEQEFRMDVSSTQLRAGS
jgi:nicotinamide mononucleotide (NMN) deamidase PncC